jgi:hypothetical protein
MNEMITQPLKGKPIDASFGTNSQGRIVDFTNRLPVGDNFPKGGSEAAKFAAALNETYAPPQTETGGGDRGNDKPRIPIGGAESNENRENFENIPVVSQANYVFSHEIKGIINAINENPQKQGFFQKIGRNVANSVRNINYDIQNGLLGSSFNVLFNRGGKIESNSSYQDLLGKVGKLKELLGSVDNQHKQVILDRIVKLEKTISNTAKTITTLAKINSTPDKTVTEAEIASQLEYGSYDDATLNITKMQQRAIKTAGFFAVSLLSGGLGAFAGVLTGAVRIGATGIMARNDLENSKTSEYRREEIQNAVPEITQYTNTIKQQVIEGKFSENGIKDLLKTLQDLIVLQAGKLPPDVEEQMLNLSSVLYQFLGSNDRQLSEPDAIEASNNFKAFVDDLGVKVNPDNAKEEVQKLHKAELDKATKKAVIIGFGTTSLAFAGGLVWKHFMEAGGVEPHQVVNDLTSKLSKGPIPINGDHDDVQGAIIATHESSSPETVAKLNKLLGTNHQNIGEFHQRQIGETTIVSVNGVTDQQIQNTVTDVAVPTEDLIRPENVTQYSDHVSLVKADEVNGNVLTLKHGDTKLSFQPGTSRSFVYDPHAGGYASVVGKDPDGNLVLANFENMSAQEKLQLDKLMHQDGALYFREITQGQSVFSGEYGGKALYDANSPQEMTTKFDKWLSGEMTGNIKIPNHQEVATQLTNSIGSTIEKHPGVFVGPNGEAINSFNDALKVGIGNLKILDPAKAKEIFPQLYAPLNTNQTQGLYTWLMQQSEIAVQTPVQPTPNNFTPSFLENLIKDLPEPYKTMATTGIIGASWGAGMGAGFGLVKGIRNAENGFVNKVVGGAKGAGAGFVKGTVTGGLFGAGAGFVGPIIGVTGANLATGAAFAGGGAELGRRMTPFWNPGNNFMNRLIGGRPRPAQAPAVAAATKAAPNRVAQNTPTTPETGREINDAEFDRLDRLYNSINNAIFGSDNNRRDICHGNNLPTLAEVNTARASLNQLQQFFNSNPNLRFNLTGTRTRDHIDLIRRESIGQVSPFAIDPNHPSPFDNRTVDEALAILADQQQREALQNQNQQGGGNEREGGNEGRENHTLNLQSFTTIRELIQNNIRRRTPQPNTPEYSALYCVYDYAQNLHRTSRDGQIQQRADRLEIDTLRIIGQDPEEPQTRYNRPREIRNDLTESSVLLEELIENLSNNPNQRAVERVRATLLERFITFSTALYDNRLTAERENIRHHLIDIAQTIQACNDRLLVAV